MEEEVEQAEIETARRIREAQGDYEAEVSCAEGADLHQHYKSCQKNPGHSNFKPVQNFKKEDLPSDYDDDDIFDWIKSEADLTCCLRVTGTCEGRPLFFPGSQHFYPCYQDFSGKYQSTWNGTGWVKSVMEYRGEVHVTICTACHVVFDSAEAKGTKCIFGYDTGETPIKECPTLTGLTVEYSDIEKDVCVMTCVTHDMELMEMLLKMESHRREMREKVMNKYGSSMNKGLGDPSVSYLTDPPSCPVVIISHPHGCNKHLTIGEWTERHTCGETSKRKDDAWDYDYIDTRYTYNADTCHGSSGAPVIRLMDPQRWWMGADYHPHSNGRGNNNKSGVVPEIVSPPTPSQKMLLNMILSDYTQTISDEDVAHVEQPASVSDEESINVQQQASVSDKESINVQQQASVSDTESINVQQPASVSDEESINVQQQASVSDTESINVQQPASVSDEESINVQQQASVSDTESINVQQQASVSDEDIAHVEKPASVSDTNVAHVEKPALVTDEESINVQQPSSVSDKNIAHVEKPASVSDKTIAHVEKPASVSDKNIALVEKPASVCDEEVAHVEKSATVSDEDVAHVEQPSSVSDKNIAHVEKPASVSDEDVGNVEQPASVSDKNIVHVEKPASVSDEDVAHVKQPASASDKESINVQQQASVSDKESINVQPPASVSDKESINVQQPASVSDEESINVQQPASVSDKESINVQQPASVSDTESINVQQQASVSDTESINVQQPASVSDTESINVQQPASVSDEESINVQQPASVSDKNIAHVEKPASVSDKNIAHVEQPTFASDEIIAHVEQPTFASDEIIAHVEQPTSAFDSAVKLFEISLDPLSNNTALSSVNDNGLKPLGVYKMDAVPRGICLVINNYKFQYDPADPRAIRLTDKEGSEKDRDSLTNSFRKCGFRVVYRENMTDQEMKTELLQFSQQNHDLYNCFVCCILSHGGENIIYGTNGHWIPERDIISPFRAQSCPSLAGKPKLFLIGTCRGNQNQYGFNVEDIPLDGRGPDPLTDLIPNEPDFLIAHASVMNYVSYYNARRGTVFINVLTEVLDEYGDSEDIHKLLMRVKGEMYHNRVLKDENGRTYRQIAESQDTLTKLLLFRPRPRNTDPVE